MQRWTIWIILTGFVLTLLSVTASSQIEGDRGVAPINSNGDFAVSGISVNTSGNNAQDARQAGWREAQRQGWQALWRQSSRSGAAPALSDATLNSIVSGIVVESEQIGPRRYIARLGVLFDRARAGQILGIRGGRLRSAPLLVFPVMISGGTEQVFESRTPWQRAWANYRTADSSVDYVRPSGAGSDSLLINVGQTGRRDRGWWRLILDQFGAADVIVPVVRLERQWPGGPIEGYFSAFFGPDRRLLGTFRLRTSNSDGLDAMLNEGVRRVDALFQQALSQGRLTPDTSLIIEDPAELEEDLLEDSLSDVEGQAVVEEAPIQATGVTVSVQYDTPDASAVADAESALRAIPGVSSAITSSLALGGTSVMQVGYSGTIDELQAALSSSGWQVRRGDGILQISR